jgi:NAD(P)-dependent dehydrogenase (short-subunit alcohol dehydrogenase family)
MARAVYDFRDDVVLVTGGGSGIGLSCARAFAAAGAKVAIADIDADAGSRAVHAIAQDGGLASFRKVDVADPVQAQAMVDWVIDEHGQLDIALNNAGIEGENVPLADWSTSNWQRLVEVNLNSVFYCMKAQLRHMVSRGAGNIVNTASVSGLIGGYHQTAYLAAKHGVVGLTKGAAMDYATAGIRINAICPGLIDTPFVAGLPPAFRDRLNFATPMSRPGTAGEIADAVLWLASDASSYVTGQALSVDGGTALGGLGTRFDDLA